MALELDRPRGEKLDLHDLADCHGGLGPGEEAKGARRRRRRRRARTCQGDRRGEVGPARTRCVRAVVLSYDASRQQHSVVYTVDGDGDVDAEHAGFPHEWKPRNRTAVPTLVGLRFRPREFRVERSPDPVWYAVTSR